MAPKNEALDNPSAGSAALAFAAFDPLPEGVAPPMGPVCEAVAVVAALAAEDSLYLYVSKMTCGRR